MGTGVVGEAFVQVKEVAVGDPMVPKTLPFAVSSRHDAIVDGSVNKIGKMRETGSELCRNSLQEVSCSGNVLGKLVRKWKSVYGLVVPSGPCVANLRLA